MKRQYCNTCQRMVQIELRHKGIWISISMIQSELCDSSFDHCFTHILNIYILYKTKVVGLQQSNVNGIQEKYQVILMHQRVFKSGQYFLQYGQHFVFGYSSSSFLQGLMNLEVFIQFIIPMGCVRQQLGVNLVNGLSSEY